MESRFLDQAGAGSRVVLRGLPPDPALQGRLMLLGLFAGAQVDVVQSRPKGPMLLRVRNTLVAIGRNEAKAMRVDVLE